MGTWHRSADGDKLPGGIGEVSRRMSRAMGSEPRSPTRRHTARHWLSRLVGLGFKVVEDGVESVRGGDGIMFGENR